MNIVRLIEHIGIFNLICLAVCPLLVVGVAAVAIKVLAERKSG